MSGSGRRIHVSRVANGDGVFFHVPDGTLEQENLKSQFPCAFGLKYLLQGQWVAVTVHNSKFQIPEEISHFVVVTETIDKARSVLGNQSLARQVSSVFGRSFANEEASTSLSSASPVTISSAPSVSGHTYRPSASVPTCSWSDAKFRQNLSRKQTRTLFSKKSKFPKTKVFKVVFVEKTDLPTSFSKSLVMCEGFLTVTDAEHEDEILNNMQAILKNSNLGFEDANEVKILTYSSRTLALPCLAAGFRWSLETLKTNVGQGKMYVMVHLNYMEAHTSSGDEVESDRTDPGLMTPEVHDSSGKSDDGDFEELGTPTVLRNIRKQRPLSEEAESDLPVAKVQQTDRRTFRPLSLLNLSERRAPVENHSDVSASSSTSAVGVSGSVLL